MRRRASDSKRESGMPFSFALRLRAIGWSEWRNDLNETVRSGRTIVLVMDLDSYRCFDAAAATLSFRAAAARVHLSPAAFSDRIRRLEEDLGVAVLRRTTRHVALTEAGQRLLPLVREALLAADRVHAAA